MPPRKKAKLNSSTKGSTTESKKTASPNVRLNRLFDQYDHRDDGTKSEWLLMPAFQQYAADLGFDDPESFDFLFLMCFLKCPACGVLTRDRFIQVWSPLELFTVEDQARSIRLHKPYSTEQIKQVYLHSFILFSTPVPSSADATTEPFTGKTSIRLPVLVAVEVWRVLFSQPGLRWESKRADWLHAWFDFLARQTDQDMGPESDDDFEPVSSITKHVWGMLPEFADRCRNEDHLDWWRPDQEWPTLLDDFAAWMNRTRLLSGVSDGQDGR